MKHATTPPKSDPMIGHQSQYLAMEVELPKSSARSPLSLSRLVGRPSRPYPTIEPRTEVTCRIDNGTYIEIASASVVRHFRCAISPELKRLALRLNGMSPFSFLRLLFISFKVTQSPQHSIVLPRGSSSLQLMTTRLSALMLSCTIGVPVLAAPWKPLRSTSLQTDQGSTRALSLSHERAPMK